jgi:hypothetical protein
MDATSVTPADSTTILIAGTIFCVALVMLAFAVIVILRHTKNRAAQASARIPKTIAGMTQQLNSQERIRRGQAEKEASDKVLGDFIQSHKARTSEPAGPVAKTASGATLPVSAMAVQTQNQDVSKPIMLSSAPDDGALARQGNPQVATPVKQGGAPEPEKVEVAPEPPKSADDPFSIFSEVTEELSPTSKFAATLNDVKIHDLNSEAQDIIRRLRPGSR